MFLAKKLNKGAGTPVTTDPQFNYVTMLLHGDGTNGAQNNTFLDSSTNSLSITRNGNTTQGSFSPYGSNWSNYFDGTSNYLTAPNNSALSLGSETYWTVEFWAYFVTSPSDYDVIVGKGPSAYEWFIEGFSDNTIDFLYTTNGSPWAGQHQITPNMGTGSWFHVAAVRNNTTFKSYVNGTEYFSGSSFNIYSASGGVLSIGGFSGGQSSNMYLSNLRIVKGTAVYTANFTPSTTPLTAITNTSLLTCQSNRFVDNSASPLTITVNGTPSVQRFNPFGASTAYSTSVIGGSAYFDGSGDYLSTPSTSNLAFGSGSFTIEAWVYANALGSYNAVFAQWPDNGGTANNSYTLETVGSTMYFYWVDSSPALFGPANLGSIQIGEWTHFAICRSGSTLYPFKNGVLGTTTSITQTLNSPSSNVTVGGQVAGAGMWNGYIANLRVLKGTALYTSNFTPPTAPVIAITNTSLLTNFTNGAIFDNAMMNDLETVGNAQISTSVYKYGTGSMSFNGTNSYLTLPYGPTQNFDTGNFTIEGWVYLNSLSASYYVVAGTWTTGTTDEWLIQISNGNTIRFLTTAGTSFYSATITTSTWYHIAAVRNGSTITLYINGTSVGSYTNSNSIGSVSKILYIGAQQSPIWYWNGYIDDFRITKGYARYTANFTPPTAAFFNTGPV